MKTLMLSAVAVLCLFASPAVLAQEVFWAVDNGVLRTIDPATQQVQSQVTLDPYLIFGSMGYVPGTGLYAYKWNAPDSENELTLIDPYSGQISIIGGLGVWFVPGSMVPDPTSGDLYMQINGQYLWRVDPETGNTISNIPFSGDGSTSYVMCFAIDEDGVGWVSNSLGDLYTLEPATAQMTKVGDLGITLYFTDVFFDREGTLWGVKGGSGSAYTIDQETAEVTYQFDIGPFDAVLYGCDALNYGTGCAGTHDKTPVLDMDGCPGVGETLSYRFEDGLPNALSLVAVGLGRGETPLAGGCTLLVDPLIALIAAALDGSGALMLPIFVPAGATGLTFTMQGFVMDPGAAAGYSSSNAVELQIP